MRSIQGFNYNSVISVNVPRYVPAMSNRLDLSSTRTCSFWYAKHVPILAQSYSTSRTFEDSSKVTLQSYLYISSFLMSYQVANSIIRKNTLLKYFVIINSCVFKGSIFNPIWTFASRCRVRHYQTFFFRVTLFCVDESQIYSQAYSKITYCSKSVTRKRNVW